MGSSAGLRCLYASIMAKKTLAQATTTAIGGYNRLRTATVAQVTSTGVMLSLNGATVGPYAWLNPYTPLVGDVVSVLIQDSAWLVLGPALAISPGLANIRQNGTGTTSSSSTPVNITSSTTVTFARAGAPLLLRLGGSCFANVAATGAQFGIHLTNTAGFDHVSTVAQQFFNPTSTHISCYGEALTTTPGAGLYTITAQMWRYTGTGTLTCDANDQITVTVQEMP